MPNYTGDSTRPCPAVSAWVTVPSPDQQLRTGPFGDPPKRRRWERVRLGYGPSQGRAPGGGAAGFRPSGPQVPILRDDRQGPDEFGNYNFNFETGDGISRQEQGAPQPPAGAVASQGGWSFTFPDGTPARFTFAADGDGYRVESDLLPTPHPLPAHAIAQIEKARREDAAAAAFSERYSAPRTSYGYP
ncbi:cuticle protein AM1239-like [Penaeus monodon]|uniref:cuticle protein AM1239-like n=1 Tax=Penaeus monodon TaxID=6687 RepID=UPI0018A7C0AC|nr:cuticle protein AM1239-like [Penaeus monodon]